MSEKLSCPENETYVTPPSPGHNIMEKCEGHNVIEKLKVGVLDFEKFSLPAGKKPLRTPLTSWKLNVGLQTYGCNSTRDTRGILVLSENKNSGKREMLIMCIAVWPVLINYSTQFPLQLAAIQHQKCSWRFEPQIMQAGPA